MDNSNTTTLLAPAGGSAAKFSDASETFVEAAASDGFASVNDILTFYFNPSLGVTVSNLTYTGADEAGLFC